MLRLIRAAESGRSRKGAKIYRVNVQDQREEHIGGNLHLANRVDHRIAGLTPKIEGKVAEDKVAIDR